MPCPFDEPMCPGPGTHGGRPGRPKCPGYAEAKARAGRVRQAALRASWTPSEHEAFKAHIRATRKSRAVPKSQWKRNQSALLDYLKG